MELVKPYIDEDYQVIFVEIENDSLHSLINGMILAIIGSYLFAIILHAIFNPNSYVIAN